MKPMNRIQEPSYFDDNENRLKTEMMTYIRWMLLRSGSDEVDIDVEGEEINYIDLDINYRVGNVVGIFMEPCCPGNGMGMLKNRKLWVNTENVWGENDSFELNEYQPYQTVRDVYQKVYEALN